MVPKHLGAIYEYVFYIRCAFFGVMNKYTDIIEGRAVLGE
jgi:hypothetical protein